MKSAVSTRVAYWSFWLAFALVVACGSVGFSQTLQIPLGTNVTTGVSMSSLSLVAPQVQITGGADQPIPLTVYFSRSVELGASNVVISARFSLDVTVTVRASQIAAVAGVGIEDYDDMSTKVKLQAASALGLQAGLPKLRSALAAMYSGSSASEEVRVSALAIGAELDNSAAEGLAHVRVDSTDAPGGTVIDIPRTFMDRAAAATGIRP